MAEGKTGSAVQKSMDESPKEKHYIVNSTINTITLPEGVTTRHGKGIITFKGIDGRVVKITDPKIQKAIESHPKFGKDIHRVPTKDDIADSKKRDQQKVELEKIREFTTMGLFQINEDLPDHTIIEICHKIGVSVSRVDKGRHPKAKLIELIKEKIKTEEEPVIEEA